jgi:hypothetical protein
MGGGGVRGLIVLIAWNLLENVFCESLVLERLKKIIHWLLCHFRKIQLNLSSNAECPGNYGI